MSEWKKRKDRDERDTMDEAMSEWKKRYGDEREALKRDRDRDLFAQLPTDLIQTILSFLITTKKLRFPSQRFVDTKEAAQTMILSKAFLLAWSSFPDLYFSDLAFSKYLQRHPNNATQASNARERFANYVLHTLTSYKQRKIPIRRLHLTANVLEGEDTYRRRRLRLTSPSMDDKDGKIANNLDQSICIANENGVKEVYLQLERIRPSNFLQTIFSLKQLVSLIFYSCVLVNNDVQDSDILINCSSLRVLKLEEVIINEALLLKLIHSCPLIEKIKLYSCKGIETIQIAHLPYLKKLKVSGIQIQSVDVKAESLEILICGYSHQLSIESAQSLRILKFESADITDALFHNLVANCPVLEELTLVNCDAIQKINVSSNSLIFLSIIVCRDLMEVIIDAPILSIFEYHGNRVLSPLSFANRGFGNRKSSVTLYWCHDEEGPSFLELSEFLITLDHTYNISLFFDSTEISFDRNIVDELRDENNIPEFDEVQIEVYSPSSTYSTIMEGLLWSFSPKIISVKNDSKGGDEFIKYLCEELLVQHYHPKISTNASNCWKNFFKRAKFSNKERDDEWFPLQSLNSLADVLDNLGDHYNLKFSRD